MTRFSEEWYDRKQANVAEWKRREAARAAADQRPKADAANRPTPPEAKPPTMARRADRTPGGAEAARAPIYPLVGMCRQAGLPEPVPEYRFHPHRKWRFDYAWPLQRIALEIDGGAWTGGRHTRGAGFIADLLKFNNATLLGWRVLRYTPQQLAQAVTDLRIMLAA